MKTTWVIHKSTIPTWIEAVDALRKEYKLRLAGKITDQRWCVLCMTAEETGGRCYGNCPWWWFTGHVCTRVRRINNDPKWATRRIKELGEWKAKLEAMK